MIVDGFIAYGNQIFRPCLGYFNKQFMDSDGVIYRIGKSEITAQLFDPFVLRDTSIGKLCALVYELVHFGYDK